MASRWTRAWQGAVLALGLLTAGIAQAANEYYLKIDGMPGESVDKAHKDWIDVDSFSWGLKLTPAATPGGGSAVGKASFNDLAWTQQVDLSTPKWFLAVATGKTIATVTLDVTRPFKGTSESFFQLVFNKTVGTGLNIYGGENASSLRADASMSSGETVTLRYRADNGKGGLTDWLEGRFSIKDNQSLATFDGDERVLLGLFSAGGAINFDAGAVTPVPEPASAALLLGGLALLAFKRRRAG